MFRDDLSPQLGGQLADLADQITGDEPMLSGGPVNLARMGRMQTALLDWMRAGWADPEKGDDISLLEVWRWVHHETGNEERSAQHGRRSSRSRRRAKRERYYHYTNARVAALLHSFIRRGLILVVKHEDGLSFIRPRSGSEAEQSHREVI